MIIDICSRLDFNILTLFQMASKYRNLIAAKSLNILQSVNQDFRMTNRSLASKLRIRYDSQQSKVWISLPMKGLASLNESDLSTLVRSYPLDCGVVGLDRAESDCIKFHLDRNRFISQVLNTTDKRPNNYHWSRNALFPEHSKRVIVEFR